MNFKTIEVGKLIQFAYDLHEKGLDFYAAGTDYVPNFKYNYGGGHPYIKRIEKGAVFGHRMYANHSDNTVYTMLGVVIGNHFENGFEYIKSVKFESANDIKKGIYIAILKPDNNSSLIYDRNNHVPDLIYDRENEWDDLSDEIKLNLFLDAMETIGFQRADILDVLEGKKTAEQAFVAVAPNDIANKRWVNFYRKHFVFDGNLLIEGGLDSIVLDSFPFPFEGPAIIDCAKVKTSCVNFGENAKGHKLININSNPNSIHFTDLKNAIIDEAIDLSIVDATWTKFGHHTVINLNKSITPLEDIDLTFAIDEYGNSFEVDENGAVQFDENGKPKVYSPLTKAFKSVHFKNYRITTKLNVLANADNENDVKIALENGTDGIGLVRTEHMFFDNDNIPLFIGLFINDENYDELLAKCTKIQKIQAANIIKNAKGRKVTFRLLDAKLDEFINHIKKYSYSHINFDKLRGAELLLEFPDIIKMQAKEILEAAFENETSVDILVPMITDEYQFSEIRDIIDDVANENGFDNYRVGAMIENIKMANNADKLSRIADFISFGTNDLTESVTGLSRHSGIADFIFLSDKVKAIIKEGIYRAKVANPDISIGFCGDHCSYIENIEFYEEVSANYIACDITFIQTAKKILHYKEQPKSFHKKFLVRSLKEYGHRKKSIY